MEEIKDGIVEEVCVVDQIESNGKGILGKVIVGGVIVAASVGAWFYKKHRDKTKNEVSCDVIDGEFTDVEEDLDSEEKK